MTQEDSIDGGWRIDRRTVLKGAGVGMLAGSALTGPAAAKPPGRSCECPEGDFLAKYDFDCVLEAVEIGTATPDGYDEDWLTLYASWGTETVFTVSLDDEVYGGWPNDPNSYMMEVVIDASYGECHDEYRFGFHGGDGEEGIGFGGYAKPNFAGPGESDDRETFHEDDVTGFWADESDDQHTYTFTIDWDTLTFEGASDTSRNSPGLADFVDIEVFGGDGGEGIGATSGCIEDVDTSVEDECLDWGFVFEDGDDVVDITYVFDDDTYNKDGEYAEPNYIEFEADGYDIQHICAYGGRDTHEETDPDGSFESDLTNPGGQEAAISNITFCGEAVITGTEGSGWSDVSANHDLNMEATYGDGTTGAGSGLTEIKIDGATPGNEDHFDWQSGESVSFQGEYDGGTFARFDVGGTTVEKDPVNEAADGALAVTVKTAPQNENDLTASVTELTIDGTPVVPGSVTATDPGTGNRDIQHIEVTGLDFSGGVEVAGELTFDFDGKNPVSSGPAMILDFD